MYIENIVTWNSYVIIFHGKNSVIPMFILFKICRIVRLCTLFVILCKLPVGGCTLRSKHSAQVVKINRGFVRIELFVAY